MLNGEEDENSQQDTQLKGGHRVIINVLDVPHMSHLTHVRRTQREEYSKEDIVASGERAIASLQLDLYRYRYR